MVIVCCVCVCVCVIESNTIRQVEIELIVNRSHLSFGLAGNPMRCLAKLRQLMQCMATVRMRNANTSVRLWTYVLPVNEQVCSLSPPPPGHVICTVNAHTHTIEMALPTRNDSATRTQTTVITVTTRYRI